MIEDLNFYKVQIETRVGSMLGKDIPGVPGGVGFYKPKPVSKTQFIGTILYYL